ncbi:glucose-6-phosphate isomerase [Ottowia sp.]|uniref:glucose-6-phosphate isomerase n=1 Tax=Ottowia sp. TaxID=1898956 RepID=UPI003A887C03
MNWQRRPRCDQTPAWPLLQAHAAQRFKGLTSGPQALAQTFAPTFDLRRAFTQDRQRFARWSFDAPPLWADLSKNLIDVEAQRLLNQLAHECGVAALRDAMLRGERINTSEQRAVTHVHGRWAGVDASSFDASNWPLTLVQQAQEAIQKIASIPPDAARIRSDMLDFAEAVRAEGVFTDVVNIGIGGSDLGPRMVVQALRSGGHAAGGPRVHFVANMDGHELAELLPQLNAARTLFIIASKTFGTAETMRNAASARDWFVAQGGQGVARHFVALSANAEAAGAFGAGRCFAFDEGVGGRYSLWSSIGLSIAIAVGRAGFEDLLRGARATDAHFATAPLARNLPVQLALIDLWYRNVLHLGSRCIAPYHHGLRRLPAYLQQLEMESNGKGVDGHGQRLAVASAPITWGEAGSNGQHAFFQMLHQGSDVVPVEFVLVRQPAHTLPGHHDKLLTNALAQARALMQGQPGDAPERHFPGNRPSTVLLLPDLSPHSLGALLALYEHRTLALGALWGINSFDQWGVELGKRHAGEIEAALHGGDASGLDASTQSLLAQIRCD